MITTIDLGPYFERIGFPGKAEPSLEVLQELHRLHPQRIAFENLSSFLGQPVSLDLGHIQRKLIAAGRGGYCYEQNLLFSEVLKAIGFEVKTLAARVRWSVPQDVVTGRSHMLFLVQVDGEWWLADVGFGGMTLTSPLRLVPDEEQATHHELFRLLQEGDEFIQEVKVGEQWKPVYRFDLHQQYPPDYEMFNWYVCTNPNSHFTTGLIVAMPARGCRYALHNNEFSRYDLAGNREKRLVTDKEDLKDILRETFKLELPRDPELDKRLQRLVAKVPEPKF